MLTHFDDFPSDPVTSRATEEYDHNDGDDHEPEDESSDDGTVFVAYFEDGGDRYADLDPDLIGNLYPSHEHVPSERTVDLAVIVDMLDGQQGYDWAMGANYWEIRPGDRNEPTGQALIESVLKRRKMKAVEPAEIDSGNKDETPVVTWFRRDQSQVSQTSGEDEEQDLDTEPGADPEDFLEDEDTETFAWGPRTIRAEPKHHDHMRE